MAQQQQADDVPPTRLVSHFSARDRAAQGQGWNSLWESEENDIWDRGMASPALVDYLAARPQIVSDVLAREGRRPRAFVPGCGRGYDATLLALRGFDVVGLDIAPLGVAAAREYAARELASPSPYNFAAGEDRHAAALANPGKAEFVCADFFDRAWEADVAAEDGFDFIYDYTFLCALLPEMRADWARRMAELLRPAGTLFCLEFPLYKDPALPGPPWGLRGAHWDLLADGNNGILVERKEGGGEGTQAGGGEFVRKEYYLPERSYESGQGTDMVSVWAKKERD
jgi:SAM-dependent methyltransferase